MIGSKIHAAALSGLAGVLVPMALAGTTAAAGESAGHHDRRARGAHRRPHHHPGIPQHNGGDRDSDNNGAPSDGDGNQ